MTTTHLEKRSGKRVTIISDKGDSVKYKFVGEDKEKSLKKTMFSKLYRELEEGESPDQLDADGLLKYKAAKTAAKEDKAENAAKSREERKAAKEKEKVERRAALTDENIKIEATAEFSKRGNAAAVCRINDKFTYISEITGAGKVSYAFLEKDGVIIPEYDNKGIKTISPFIAKELGVKPEAMEFMLKEKRATCIAESKITPEQVLAKKKEIKEAKAAAQAKEAEEVKAAKEKEKADKAAKAEKLKKVSK